MPTKQQNTLLYNSADFPYQTLIKTYVNVESKHSDGETVVKNSATTPVAINIYDHKEYLQVDIIYNANAQNGCEDAYTAKYAMDITDVAQTYKNHWIRCSVDIFPNKDAPSVVLHLNIVENIISIKDNENHIIVSFCTPTEFCYINADNNKLDYNRINHVVNFSTISQAESQMIKKHIEIHNKQDFQHKKEKKESILDKLFKPSKSKEELNRDKLIESLNMSEQEMKIFDPSILSVANGEVDSTFALQKLVGLEFVKQEIKKLNAKLKYRKKQQSRNIFVDTTNSMHMCFTGSPGTGKTTVARIITGLLYSMGYIKENKCIEVNGQNLKGGYTGQTAIITKLVLKSAKNKVLFIDEAYALFDDYNGFGKEAVAVILKQMEDDRDNTVVVFAGYKDDMEQLLKMNDGLKSRINRYIDFPNYSVTELTEILMLNLKNKKLYITEEALEKCVLAFKKAEISERFSNGRFVRNLLEKIEYEHAYNTSKIKDTKRQDTIEIQDIPDELINELLTRSM